MTNKVIEIGRISKDLFISKGSVRATIAVTQNYKNKETGEYGADFINFVAFGNTAKFLEQYIAKGDLISVEGKLVSNSYEKDGKTVFTQEFVGESVNILAKANSKDTESEAPAEKATPKAPKAAKKEEVVEETPITDSDLPF